MDKARKAKDHHPIRKVIRFVQPHCGRNLTFQGEILSKEKVNGEVVYHVVINFTDGTLFALVREQQIIGDNVPCLLSNPR